MKRVLNISIVDNNQYFMMGFRQVLFDFYLTKNIHVRFIDSNMSEELVDILFYSSPHNVTIDFHRLFRNGLSQSLIFVIRDKNEINLSQMLRCVKKNESIYRHQSIDLILDIIEQARAIEHPSLVPTYDLTEIITRREYEVLHFLKLGKRLTDVAYYMNLSIKTVSAHKRSAMRKLNFERNTELFYWMLNGGLPDKKTYREPLHLI